MSFPRRKLTEEELKTFPLVEEEFDEILSDSDDDYEVHEAEEDEIGSSPEWDEKFAFDITGEEFKSKNGETSWTTAIPHPSKRQASNIIDRALYRHGGLTDYSRFVESKVEAFELFMDDNIIRHIVNETNRKARVVFEYHRVLDEKCHEVELDDNEFASKWVDTDIVEMKAFIGILLFAGQSRAKKVPIISLWSTEAGNSITFYHSTMARNRFKQLLRFIRFDDGATREERLDRDQNGIPRNKLAHIDEVMKVFVANLKLAFNPGPYVCIDEDLQSFHGRCSFKVFMKMKHAKYGLKWWTEVDTEFLYVWNLQIYTGAKGKGREVNQGQRVVTDLVEGLPQGLGVICDNFFTSLELAKRLSEKHLTLLGTMRKNRKELPEILLPSKSRDVFSTIALHYVPLEGEKFKAMLLSYVPKPNKAVIFLSTQHQDKAISSVELKPQANLDYNLGKAAVDSLDRIFADSSCARNTRRWPLAVFFHLLNIAWNNACVIYSTKYPSYHSGKTELRRLFLKELAYDLCMPQMARRELSRLPKYIRFHIQEILETHKFDLDDWLQRNKTLLANEGIKYTNLLKTKQQHDQDDNLEIITTQKGHKKKKRCEFFCPRDLDRKTTVMCDRCQHFSCTQCDQVHTVNLCGECATDIGIKIE